MKMTYERFIEPYIRSLQEELPSIAVEGLKGIGKTVSAKRVSKTIFELSQVKDKELFANMIDDIRLLEKPILIDEWQNMPSSWELVRRNTDEGAPPGSYLLTGSIANENLNIHSGAGRIYRLTMYPLSLAERNVEKASVSLSSILDARTPFSAKITGVTDFSFADYMEEIVASGLPGLRHYSPPRRRLMLASYFDNILSHEFRQQGIGVRQPQTLFRWLRAYAAAVATDAGYNEILDASTPGERDKPAAKTTLAYREALENLWLIDELPTWINGEDYFTRMKRTPKHYLADPAFAVHLLGLTKDDLCGLPAQNKAEPAFSNKYGNVSGRLFESLIQLSLRTYCVVNDARLSYAKDRDGRHEIDFIVQRDQKIIAIEVKMTPSVESNDVKHLLWLKELMAGALSDAIIITAGPAAYRRTDGIAVVPAALLGP